MSLTGDVDASPRPPTVRLRIDLAYDGTPFRGFARQPDQTTVQGTLEGALSRVLGQTVDTTCAGRTDRGVHALAQVVHLDVDPTRPAARRSLADVLTVEDAPLADAPLADGLLTDGRHGEGRHGDGTAGAGVGTGRPPWRRHGRDAALLRRRLDQLVGKLSGRAITVWRATVVDGRFDARFSATERRYRYRLVDAATLSPLSRVDRWHVDGPLQLRPVREAAALLLGEHDFCAFCKRAPGRSTVRRLDEIAVHRPSAGQVHVRLRGPAFCHTQVRSIVGCLVEVGRGRWAPERVGEVLQAGDRKALARLAPPHGLTLERVSYGRRWPAAPPADAPVDVPR